MENVFETVAFNAIEEMHKVQLKNAELIAQLEFANAKIKNYEKMLNINSEGFSTNDPMPSTKPKASLKRRRNDSS